MQNRISRLRALNALADAMIELKVALLEIEGVGLQYRPVTMATDGGPGSGNFNHAGRPGEVGGSAPSDGGSGSSSASTGRPGTISMKSEDFGKPGKYTLYRNGIVKNNGMIFFAVKKEYADTYADDESKGGAEQKTDEFEVSIERPLIIKGATDVQCIRLAYEAMNPGKKAVSINKFSNSHWMRYDKENEKALSAPGSQYDSIIYIINGRPKEVQISGKKAKSDAVKTGEYTTTAWSRLGWNMEEAKEKGYFEQEPNDYTYKPLTNDRMSVRDGGEGSGNFGHAGRPGEVGGSAPSSSAPGGGGSATTSKKLYEGIKNDRITRILEERRQNRYYTFGKTDAEVNAQNATLARELKKEGASITAIEHKLHGTEYRVFHPDMSLQEIQIAEHSLNGIPVVTTAEEYIAKCKEKGVAPKLHVVPDEVPGQFLKKTDGTPVYANLSPESQLTNDELAKYSEGKDALEKASAKAIASWDDSTLNAVKTYTSEYGINNYSGINRFLATGEKANNETEAVAGIITKALDHEIGADCALFRGVSDFSRESGLEANDKLLRKIVRGDYSVAGQLRDALVGKEVTNKHVASTSTKRDHETYGQRPVQILFKTPASAKAVNISKASVYGGGANRATQMLATAMGKSIAQEEEVAFKPGMRYRIDSVDFSQNTMGNKIRGQVMITATVLTGSKAKDSDWR